jgi:ABC-2 type transport system ATP-binding protein
MAVIETHELTKRYGSARGIEGLSMTVKSGEVFGFLGPNGAGKTTTIRTLLDLLHPTSGSAMIFGLDSRSDSLAIRARLGNLPGDFAYDPRLTGRELLSYLAEIRGVRGLGRAPALAERFRAELDRALGELSRGNRQKVGIVQAFMHEPELLILDEPTSGLDPFLQQEFVHLVQAAKRRGATVFMSSHVMSEVQQTADRVGIIRDGRLLAVESVQSLREHALRSVTLTFGGPFDADDFSRLPGFADVTVTGRTLRGRLAGHTDELVKAASRYDVADLLCEEPDLE